MSEAVVVESQPTMEVERGPLVNMTSEQRQEFRMTGKMPEPPKPEESAPSTESSETPKVETAAESEPAKPQETTEKPKGKSAEERIAQLEATIEKIRKGAGIERKTEPAAVPEPKEPAQPRTYDEWLKTFNGKAWRDKYIAEHPNVEFEDVMDAQADYKADMRKHFDAITQAQKADEQAFAAKMDEARSRYEKFDDVIGPGMERLAKEVTGTPRQMLVDSDVAGHLIFTITGNEETLDKFVKLAKEKPRKAIEYIVLTEQLIHENLNKASEPKSEPPAPPRTQAPKPPAEVGGRAATPGDPLEAAAKANDYRAFKAAANAKELARLKG